jgi:copper chaperone CopZ
VRPALVLFAALLAGCGGALPAAAPPPPHLVQAAPTADLAVGQDEVSMEIIELMCRPCASQIVGDARSLPGMISVHMELATKTLTLRFDTGVTQRDRVIAAMEQIVSQIQ